MFISRKRDAVVKLILEINGEAYNDLFEKLITVIVVFFLSLFFFFLSFHNVFT